MRLNIFHMISVIAVFQSLFLSVFFLQHKKGIRLSNRILGFCLLIFAVLIAYAFTLSSGSSEYYYQYYTLCFIISLLPFLVGPFLYFYVRSVVIPDFRLEWRHLGHLSPFLLSVVAFFFRPGS